MHVKILHVSGLAVIPAYVGLPVGHVHSTLDEALSTLSRLVKAGDEHAKLCRMIIAYFEITAPRYWWQEMSTYRVGVETYSASTMHTLVKRPLSRDDFENGAASGRILVNLNTFIENGDLLSAKRMLPESFLQTRLVMASYQALRRIWTQRRKHKLPEWRLFLDRVAELPMSKELITVK